MISAGLISVLAALLVTNAHHNLRAFMRIHEDVRENAQKVQARELIDGIAEDMDSHRFAVFPVIHHEGRIAYADGTQNSLASSASANAPDSSSDAITSFACEGTQVLRVLNAGDDGGVFTFFTCSFYEPPSDSGEEKGFIGASADSLIYLLGTIHNSSQHGCQTAVLRQSKNMIMPERDYKDPLGVRILVPIQREYTIYLSKKGELRYAGHRGAENIENQPLFGPIEKLTFESRETLAGRITAVDAVFTFPLKRTFAYGAVHHLSRISHLNLLLS